MRADVGNARVRRRPSVAMRRHGGRGRPPQDLDHDWLPPHGLHHRFFMLHFGEVTCIHLMREDITWSPSGAKSVLVSSLSLVATSGGFKKRRQKVTPNRCGGALFIQGQLVHTHLLFSETTLFTFTPERLAALKHLRDTAAECSCKGHFGGNSR